MTDWTKEEDEAFNEVEKQSNLGKQILKAAVLAEREACARLCDALAVHPEYASEVTKLAALAIRARGQA
jgi:hypothetical protein